MYVGNPRVIVTESDLGKLFGLRTTNYLKLFILAPCQVCDELVKLRGLEFHGRKIITEKSKTIPRALVNKSSTNAVANDQRNMHKMAPTISDVRSRLPTAPTEEQNPIQNIKSTFPNAIIPKKTFIQYTLRHEIKVSKFPGE